MLLEGLRPESLYYNAYYRLRQPLIKMLFQGVAWDRESASVVAQKLREEKNELKERLDTSTGGVQLYSVTWRRSGELLELYARQRELRGAKKGLTRTDEKRREIQTALDKVAGEIRALKDSGGDKRADRGEGLSTSKICEYLYGNLGMKKKWKKRKDTGKTTETVDEVALLHLAQEHPRWEPLITLIRRHRRCEKLISTYLKPDKLLSPLDGRFHSHYKTFGTQSGRLASGSDPWGFGGNAQNLDREYKWLMLPDKEA